MRTYSLRNLQRPLAAPVEVELSAPRPVPELARPASSLTAKASTNSFRSPAISRMASIPKSLGRNIFRSGSKIAVVTDTGPTQAPTRSTRQSSERRSGGRLKSPPADAQDHPEVLPAVPRVPSRELSVISDPSAIQPSRPSFVATSVESLAEPIANKHEEGQESGPAVDVHNSMETEMVREQEDNTGSARADLKTAEHGSYAVEVDKNVNGEPSILKTVSAKSIMDHSVATEEISSQRAVKHETYTGNPSWTSAGDSIDLVGEHIEAEPKQLQREVADMLEQGRTNETNDVTQA